MKKGWVGKNTDNSIEFQETKPPFPNFLPPKKIQLETKKITYKTTERTGSNY